MGGLNIAFVVWRELFEAVLIVSIVYGFLSRQIGQAKARRLAGYGVAAGVALSAALGAVFQILQHSLSADALDHFQTAVLLLCAGFMTHMCLWMHRHGRLLKKELEHSLSDALAKVNGFAVSALVALAIAREGFEIVVYLYGMGVAAGPSAVLIGSATGAALAAVSGWALLTGIRFIDPRWFFRMTGLFLLVTAGSLVINAVGRLLQSGVLPPLMDQVWDTSALLDDQSTIGHFIAQVTGYQSTPALMTVLAYATYWLIFAVARLASRSQPQRQTSSVPTTTTLAATSLVAVSLFAVAPKGQAQTALTAPSSDNLKLKFEAYGDLQFALMDYQPTTVTNTASGKGPGRDFRASFDTTRLAAELEGFYVPYNIEFEAEVEFEHGGTGAAKDLDQHEGGEYETEAEKGGEVYLEEFYLRKHLNADVSIAAGRIMVGVGLVSLYNRPTDYLAVGRAEAEEHLLPDAWNEMGLELKAELGSFKVLLQGVNGLDSTGFSSENWVSTGHQGSFEQTSGTDMAGVLRLDYTGITGTVLGASGYYGGTTRNRPPEDMQSSANLLLTDVHAQVNLERLRGSGDVIWGELQHADQVSNANRKDLPTNYDAAQTDVASQGFGAWSEVGYDIAPSLNLGTDVQCEPFVRYDYYDTMYKVPTAETKNPLYTRKVVTIGAAYTVAHSLFLKVDVSQRRFGLASIRRQNSAELGLGFIM